MNIQFISIKELKPKIREFKLSLYLLTRNHVTMMSLVVLCSLTLIAVFAPYIVPYPSHCYIANNPADKLLPPSGQYFFGTDELGRDIFSRVLYGTRISLWAAVSVVGVALLLGTFLGAIAGTMGKVADEVIMRITDLFMSFPSLLLSIALTALLGPSLYNAEIALIVSWWPWYARLVRGQAISLKERQFVKAAEAIGTPRIVIVLRHIIPNCISPVIVQASMDMGCVIIALASLSFLGLGAQAPTPEWGLMVSTSKNYFMNAWWYSVFPGIAIFITVMAFNLLGDGLREILDPKTRKI